MSYFYLCIYDTWYSTGLLARHLISVFKCSELNGAELQCLKYGEVIIYAEGVNVNITQSMEF